MKRTTMAAIAGPIMGRRAIPQMSARRLAGVLLFVVLAGCASDPAYRERLANACKVQECVCQKRAALIFTERPIPVLWDGKNGAYCPEGYSIQIARKTREREDP